MVSPKSATRMSLYRLIGLDDSTDAVKEKYASQFLPVPVPVADRACIMLCGDLGERPARWAATLSNLTGAAVDQTSKTAAAVLLIPGTSSDGEEDNSESVVWAVTFGMGHILLDQRYVDSGFGQRVAIRSADPETLNSITKVTVDDRARTERATIPTGASLRRFGFEEIGEFATRLVAAGTIKGVGEEDSAVTIRGADALNLPLSLEPKALLTELDAIAELLTKPPVNNDLALMEQFALIKSSDKDLVAELDARLVEQIVSDSPSALGLSWPHESTDEYDNADHFRVTGTRAKKRDGLPTLEDIVEPIRAADEENRVAKLTSTKVLLLRDDDNEASPMIPLKKWFAFETTVDNKRYFLNGGRWYRMEQSYIETVRRRTREIFSRPTDFLSGEIPSWPADMGAENEYNAVLAEALGGLCLDQKLISVEGQRSRIEACDVLLPDGVFIHVKRADSSAPTSHLFAQALVSADLLTYDTQAQAELAQKIRDQGADPGDYGLAPKKVVIVMAKDNAVLAPDDLYTFAQVNLGRQDRLLASHDVGVFVIAIERKTNG